MKVPQPSPQDSSSPRLRGARRRRFQAAVLEWYASRARPLRIRSTTDPWALLVAEVMAQQTQIARVDEAWVGFMKHYPTPRHLAEASTADVLRAWSGLGYNRRAVNLQRAARAIEADHGGRVPSDIAVLETLPGVGPYTARALAATAFGQPVAPVDTNVRRVVSRVVGEPLGRAQLQHAADELVFVPDPATWTHASMDLGAAVCRSRRPLCDECPVSRWCVSAGTVEPATSRGAAGMPFEQTSRWLRGRIVARLRALDGDAWTRLPAAIGDHDAEAIRVAVAGLEQDGLLERSPDGSVRLPSSQT
jgi:A/G-specific adenine glycosylase